MITNRNKVYAAISAERDYQDSLRDVGKFSEEVLSLPGELTCIQVYLDKAMASYADNSGEAPEETMRIVCKIAAMCVRAMEHHGAPPRI